MSSTNRGSARNTDDFYATPSWCTAAILPHLDPGVPLPVVLDPGCGDGAILRVCHERWPSAVLLGYDIEDRGCGWCYVRDALDPKPWDHPDVIVCNPPFSLAMEFLERALHEVAPGGEVAFLLRLAWMAGQKRATFHRAHPSDVYVLPRRPSFTGNGKSDSADYCWMVWGPRRGGRWSVLDAGRVAA